MNNNISFDSFFAPTSDAKPTEAYVKLSSQGAYGIVLMTRVFEKHLETMITEQRRLGLTDESHLKLDKINGEVRTFLNSLCVAFDMPVVEASKKMAAYIC